MGEALINKNIFYVLVFITIFGLASVSLFVVNQNISLQNQLGDYQGQITELQNQNSELNNQISELENQLSQVTNLVKITRFTKTGFSPICGMLIVSTANVTVHNFGINDVNGLTLSIKFYDVETLSEPLQIGNLSAGEERTISHSILWILTNDPDEPFVATLWLGDQLLDEYILGHSAGLP